MIDFWSILPGGLLLFLPGYALSRLVPGEDMKPFQRALVSVGLSLALMPLLLLWTTVAGLSWGGPTAWALILLSGLISLRTWGGRTNRDKAGGSDSDTAQLATSSGAAQLALRSDTAQLIVRYQARLRNNAPFVLLAALFITSLAVRLLAIRDVSIPLWGDSLHHSWLARLIAERGQAPDSFYPYFPLDSVTYHVGYHSMVAFFSWTTGLPIVKSVLIFGQMLNALSVLTIYLLAHRLTRSHRAALLGGLVVGLVSVLPAYYVNWGRYTQLAGQVILPVALFLALEAIERRHWGYLALAAAAAAGLFLTHYRVILFYVAFLVAYLAWRALTSPRRDAPVGRLPVGRPLVAHPPIPAGGDPAAGTDRPTGGDAPVGRLPIPTDADAPARSDRSAGGDAPPGRLYVIIGDVLWAGAVGISALALAFPRLWYLAINLPRGEASAPKLSPEAWEQWMASYNALGDVGSFLSWPLLALTVAGFLWAIFRKERAGLITGGWVALLFLMANAERLGLGRGAWLNNFAVLIALYLPASVVLGWLGAQALEISGRAWKAAPYLLAFLAAAAGIWSGWGLPNILDSRYVLATPADQRAMIWIKDNTPEDARFLVNYFFADGGRSVVGSDAGWWLSYLAGRETTVPPILYATESSPERDYAARINALARSLQGQVYTREGRLLMQQEGISHIFIGEKGGFLDPNKLIAAGHRPVYRDGTVWVFAVSYPAAGP